MMGGAVRPEDERQLVQGAIEPEQAAGLVERIFILEGTPDVAAGDKLKVDSDVTTMIKKNPNNERFVRGGLVDAIAECD